MEKIRVDEFYNIKGLLKDNYQYYSLFFKRIIDLVRTLGNTKIDSRVIATINIRHEKMTRPYELINELTLIYAPQLLMYDFMVLIDTCNEVFWEAERFWKKYHIYTGNEFLDKLYSFLRKLNLNGNDYYRQKILNGRIIYRDDFTSLIILYLHCNNKFDEDTFVDYLMNYDYYAEKLSLNGLAITDYHYHTYDQLKTIFDNFETLINKEKVIIR